MEMKCAFIIQLFTVFHQITEIDSACTLPAELEGIWWDSRVNGPIEITSGGNVTSGWEIGPYQTYSCEDSDNQRWLFRSSRFDFKFGVYYYGIFCLRYTKITDNSYSYYLDSHKEPEYSNVRIAVKTAPNSGPFTISYGCNSSNDLGTEEFHVLLKENLQSSLQQNFPEAILGKYAYEVTDASSSVTCGPGSVWDVCTDRTTMTFNYTQCSTVMFGATNAELFATQSYTSGSTTYVIVVNGDTSPASDSFFTCLAISGTSVSSNPGSCEIGQSATSRTSSSDSVLISLTPYELCPFTTDDSPAASSNIGIIVGVVVVLVLIICCVVAFIVYFKVIKKKPFPCQKTKVENIENEKTPPGKAVEPSSPKMVVDMVPEKKTLPPLSNQPPPIDVNKNQPLPSITRQ